MEPPPSKRACVDAPAIEPVSSTRASADAPAPSPPLRVLYRDADWLIIDKPFDVLMDGSPPTGITMASLVAAQFPLLD